jgi:hypothetical protein
LVTRSGVRCAVCGWAWDKALSGPGVSRWRAVRGVVGLGVWGF